MKLAAKLILVFIVAVVAVTALASHFNSQQFFSYLQQRHMAAAKSIEEANQHADFHKAIDSGDHVYFQKMFKAAAGGDTEVRWVWFEETVSAQFRPRLSDNRVLNDARRKMTSVQQESETGRHLVTYCPVSHQGKNGAVEITSSLEEIDRETRRTWLNGLISIAAMGLLSVGFVMIASVRWIARPLEKLTDKMRRVGEGDFASDLQINSNDELGHLAGAVNQMCDRLREQKETIATATQHKLEAIDQLRHADRLKTIGQLAAGVAHEVGTPLNVISGRASMILSASSPEHEQMQQHATEIKKESERISSIVKQLLDFARQSPSKKSRGDLREVISHSVELLRPIAAKRQIDLAIGLPDREATAEFDFNQLQQVLINLIDNAIDASQDGRTVEVSVDENDAGEAWKISVRDQGHGIDPQHQNEIFQPFFTTKQVGDGTGLGLSIVHGIIEEHGGAISVESEPSQGSTFTLLIPKSTPR